MVGETDIRFGTSRGIDDMAACRFHLPSSVFEAIVPGVSVEGCTPDTCKAPLKQPVHTAFNLANMWVCLF